MRSGTAAGDREKNSRNQKTQDGGAVARAVEPGGSPEGTGRVGGESMLTASLSQAPRVVPVHGCVAAFSRLGGIAA